MGKIARKRARWRNHAFRVAFFSDVFTVRLILIVYFLDVFFQMISRSPVSILSLLVSGIETFFLSLFNIFGGLNGLHILSPSCCRIFLHMLKSLENEITDEHIDGRARKC